MATKTKPAPAESTAGSLETAKKLGLLEEEYERIKEVLGRVPNFTELGIYSAMWSEHCSYKNSIALLKTLPRKGPKLLVEAGEENAGLSDIGDGWACAFKIESHNHPSAIEPYQGAATGVGGCNRHIFTMGARPIAQLNSLRFGDISTQASSRWHMRGVVKSIGDYGNAFGVPVLGGEVNFDPCYTTNPLVNAMSVGIVRADKVISATSHGVGNPVYIVGSATGKDGIHGASFASKDITGTSMDDLPAVQVGDPFMEKLLLEASLELAQTDAIIGMQDMGAAGITCSTSEMSAKGKSGMDIQLDRVPLRQDDMKPWEMMLSESQERMLVVVKKGREQEVKDIFDKWDLHCVEIGTVTEGDTLRFFWKDELVAEVPAESLVLGGGAPVYKREKKEPARIAENRKFKTDMVPVPQDLEQVLEWRNHPDIRRHMYTHHEIGMAEHRAWFERSAADPGRHLLIAEAQGQALGFVHFRQVDTGRVADWGFYAVPHAPKGSGRRLGNAALQYAFGILGLHKVCGQALESNERSIALHRALGFSEEGRLREQHFDGRHYRAVLCFGLLASEWQRASRENEP